MRLHNAELQPSPLMSALTWKRVANCRALIGPNALSGWSLRFYFYCFFRTWHSVVLYSTSVATSKRWASILFYFYFLSPLAWYRGKWGTPSLRLSIWVGTGREGKLGVSSLSLLHRWVLVFKSSSAKQRKGSLAVCVQSGGEENDPWLTWTGSYWDIAWQDRMSLLSSFVVCCSQSQLHLLLKIAALPTCE